MRHFFRMDLRLGDSRGAFFLSAIVLFCCSLVSSAATPSQKLGEPITLKKESSLSEISKNPKQYQKMEVLLVGEVKKVCQKSGCWMDFQQGGKRARVTFKDYGFFVPKDSKGRKARIQGVVKAAKVRGSHSEDHKAHQAHKQANGRLPIRLVASGVELN